MVSRFTRNDDVLKPRALHGGIAVSGFRVGLCRFLTPRTFQVCEAVTLKGARGPIPSDARGIAGNRFSNWAHASARQHTRILVDAGGGGGEGPAKFCWTLQMTPRGSARRVRPWASRLMCRQPVRQWFARPVKERGRASPSWVTSSPCTPRASVRNVPFRQGSFPGTHRKRGMLSRRPGFRAMEPLGRFKWVQAGNGRMKPGLISARNGTAVFSYREVAPVRVCLSVGMV